MPKIKCNDISLYYETHGTGTPIVFIAGFSVDHTNWQEIIGLFPGYQCILFDNRGAGQSDVPAGPYTIEEMALDVVALCTALKIQSAHFVGNSMGGYILQTLALKHPHLIKSAVISNCGMHPAINFGIFLQSQLELRKALAPVASLVKASCAWVFSSHFLTQPGKLSGLIQLSLDNPFPFSIPGFEAQRAALAQFNSTNWASDIQVPSLVIASDEDLIFSDNEVHALATQIPHAKYHCFTNCGHVPQLEQPQNFSKIVMDFLNSLSNS